MTATRHKDGREITSGTREWADHNVNCVKGCFNNCRYCYAKVIAKRFHRCTEQTWRTMDINSKAVTRNYGKMSGRVMFPSTHDIVDIRGIKEACFAVIDKLLASGNDVLITTKPRLSITKQIIKKFLARRHQLQFRFTITSLDNGQLSFWEPNAPDFQERFASLKYAHKKRFKTSVSIEPFLDYNPRPLIDVMLPYVTESIWIGPMNYIPRNGVSSKDESRYTRIREAYTSERLRAIYDDIKDIPQIRLKDSMRNRLSFLDVPTPPYKQTPPCGPTRLG